MSVRQSGVTLISAGVSMPPYNNFTLTISGGSSEIETWKFYRGATQVAQWVLTYTSSARTTLTSGVYSDLSS